jgi:hypothetical protein
MGREFDYRFENKFWNRQLQGLQTKASAKFTNPHGELFILFVDMKDGYCLVKKPLGVAVWSNSYE